MANSEEQDKVMNLNEYIFEYSHIMRGIMDNPFTVEVKMQKFEIENEPDLYVQLPRKQHGFVLQCDSGLGFSHLKCHLDGCNVRAICSYGRFYVKKDAFHSHEPDDEIIAKKLLHQKMHELIENTKKSQKPNKRRWNQDTKDYIKANISPKVDEFKEYLSQNVSLFAGIVHGQVLKALESIIDQLARPFIDHVKIALQEFSCDKDDSTVDVDGCKKTFFHEKMSIKSSFLQDVSLLYKEVYKAIIPKHMASLEQKLNSIVEKISSTWITFCGESNLPAKKAKP